MLKEATYANGSEVVKVSVERLDVLVKSENEIVNFPGIIELEGDNLALVHASGRHGGKAEGRHALVSNDLGRTWANAPVGSPWTDNVHNSGILGYLKNDILAYIDVFPLEALERNWNREKDGPYHALQVHQVKDPTFRIRRFSRAGHLLEDSTFKLVNLPWKEASYELYGTLLEMEDGSFLTAFLAHAGPVVNNKHDFSVSIGKSVDGCKTFELLHTFQSSMVDLPAGNQGFSEPDVAILDNGDILCVMRTGGATPLYQSRSKDGGLTWSVPVSVGWPGVKPKLKLLSNGVLACTGGRGHYGHPQVTYAMFSLDGTGETWEYPLAFHTGPGCSYTTNMERDGKFYVVYSDSSFQKELHTYNQPFQSIKWAVMDITKESIRQASKEKK